MTSFENYYLQCPCCKSWLTGKQAKLDSVNQSLLYSDGMVISDLLPISHQKIVLCPACAAFFWRDEQTAEKDKAVLQGFHAYPWSSWHLFGCNLLSSAGRKALIKHYWCVLDKITPLDEQQEIAIRKSLLWAYNDLYRDALSFSIKDVYNSKFSLQSWLNLRLFHKRNRLFYEAEQANFQTNLLLLIALTEKLPEPDAAELAELYREAGDFKKAAEIIEKIDRRTHFINSLIKYIEKGERRVFKVAG